MHVHGLLTAVELTGFFHCFGCSLGVPKGVHNMGTIGSLIGLYTPRVRCSIDMLLKILFEVESDTLG